LEGVATVSNPRVRTEPHPPGEEPEFIKAGLKNISKEILEIFLINIFNQKSAIWRFFG